MKQAIQDLVFIFSASFYGQRSSVCHLF